VVGQDSLMDTLIELLW